MYRYRTTGLVVSKQQLIYDHPNISLPAEWTPEVLDILDVDYVKPVARPDITATQRLVEGQPEQREDGRRYQTWRVEDLGTEEVAALVVGAKEAACARLNAKRDEIEYGVFTDSHGIRYDVDGKGREKMTGLTAMLGATGVALPAGFTWTTADNAEQPTTPRHFWG